jgi:hypothetical protein
MTHLSDRLISEMSLEVDRVFETEDEYLSVPIDDAEVDSLEQLLRTWS